MQRGNGGAMEGRWKGEDGLVIGSVLVSPLIWMFTPEDAGNLLPSTVPYLPHILTHPTYLRYTWRCSGQRTSRARLTSRSAWKVTMGRRAGSCRTPLSSRAVRLGFGFLCWRARLRLSVATMSGTLAQAPPCPFEGSCTCTRANEQCMGTEMCTCSTLAEVTTMSR